MATGIAIAGLGTSLLGMSSASKAAKSQERANAANLAFQKESQEQQLDFDKRVYADTQAEYKLGQQVAQQQYDEWEQTFGSIQENMANYYQAMDPRDFAKFNKATIDDSYQQASESLSKNLAQRGIQGGGVEAGAMSNLESATALQRGQNQIQSEFAYADAQNKFLGSGNAQSQAQTNMLNSYNPAAIGMGAAGINQAYSNTAGIGNAYANQSNMYGNQAAQGRQDVTGGLQSFMHYGNQAGMFDPPKYQAPDSVGWGMD